MVAVLANGQIGRNHLEVPVCTQASRRPDHFQLKSMDVRLALQHVKPMPLVLSLRGQVHHPLPEQLHVPRVVVVTLKDTKTARLLKIVTFRDGNLVRTLRKSKTSQMI
jgi:hypothetical protein